MIVTLLIGVSAVVILDNAETDGSPTQIPVIGKCGDGVAYSVYSDGTMVISGTGGTYDYSETKAPWAYNGGAIKKIVICDTVTSLGENVFSDCVNLKELTIPITLNSVRSNAHPAFAGCTGIEKVNLTYGTNGNGYGYDAYPVNDRWYQNTPWYLSRNSLKEVNFADGIKSIGSDSFRELKITSVAIPDSVRALGNHVFYNCTELTDLTYPVSLKPFDDEKYPAFNGCAAIKKVTLTRGNGVPFDYCKWAYYEYKSDHYELAPWNLNPDVAKTIVISDNVSSLGDMMFYHCNIKEISMPISIDFSESSNPFGGIKENLEKVTITKGTGTGYDNSTGHEDTPWNYVPSVKDVIVKDGVTRIGSKTFCNCSIENLVLPNSLVSFGKGETFVECTIKNLTIPISLNATWNNYDPAFTDVSGLEKVTFTPGSGYGFNYALHLEDHFWNRKTDNNWWYRETPWYQCGSTMREIVFEDGIKSIGANAFRDMYINQVVIPDSVESLGDHAFCNCNGLINITVPTDLDTVGSNNNPAFEGCTNIANITFTSKTGIWHKYCTDPGQGSYYKNTPWNLTHADLTVTIRGVEHIGEFIFQDWNPHIHLHLEGITSIDKGAFYGCKQLQSVSASSDLIRIDQLAFAYCPSLQSVHIPDSVTSIGYASFANCPSLTDLHIGNSVASIGGSAFYHCGSLSSAVIPDSVKSIGTYAFDNCRSLVSVTIGNSVESIGNYAFNCCTSLTSVSLPDSVTSVGKAAFAYCWALSEANLGNSVTAISDYAFYQCTELTSVTIPDSVTSIGYAAFAYSSLTELDLGSVATTGDYAFYQCTKLTDVTIPDSVTAVGNYAFYDSLDNLEHIYVSKNLESLGNEAFGYSHDTVKIVNRAYVFTYETNMSCFALAGHQYTVEHDSGKVVFTQC